MKKRQQSPMSHWTCRQWNSSNPLRTLQILSRSFQQAKFRIQTVGQSHRAGCQFQTPPTSTEMGRWTSSRPNLHSGKIPSRNRPKKHHLLQTHHPLSHRHPWTCQSRESPRYQFPRTRNPPLPCLQLRWIYQNRSPQKSTMQKLKKTGRSGRGTSRKSGPLRTSTGNFKPLFEQPRNRTQRKQPSFSMRSDHIWGTVPHWCTPWADY